MFIPEQRRASDKSSSSWPVVYRWLATGTLVAYTAVGCQKVAAAPQPLERRRPLGLPLVLACRGPRFLEHDDVGLERLDGGDVVVGPAPPVHPAVHVVIGDAEHGAARR